MFFHQLFELQKPGSRSDLFENAESGSAMKPMRIRNTGIWIRNRNSEAQIRKSVPTKCYRSGALVA